MLLLTVCYMRIYMCIIGHGLLWCRPCRQVLVVFGLSAYDLFSPASTTFMGHMGEPPFFDAVQVRGAGCTADGAGSLGLPPHAAMAPNGPGAWSAWGPSI